MQKLWCVSFNGFRNIVNKEGWDINVPPSIAIISINSSGNICPGEETHLCHGTNVLNLNFDDAEPFSYGLEDYTTDATITTSDGENIRINFFTPEMAQECVKFIEGNKDKDFYIHCSAGVSRSQAFVKYINNVYFDKEFQTNPNNPCLHPNGYVYQLLMEKYREM